MPLPQTSRHRKAPILVDDGLLLRNRTISFLGDYVPFRFVERIDNRVYIVRRGDKITHIAQTFYADPALWWVLADFQPVPILNPLANLEIGREIVGPSVDFLYREILR